MSSWWLCCSYNPRKKVHSVIQLMSAKDLKPLDIHYEISAVYEWCVNIQASNLQLVYEIQDRHKKLIWLTIPGKHTQDAVYRCCGREITTKSFFLLEFWCWFADGANVLGAMQGSYTEKLRCYFSCTTQKFCVIYIF